MKRKNTPEKNQVAFEFVVESLESLRPVVRPMFGCHALYSGEKILLILRKKVSHPLDNGLLIATTPDHHESLKRDFPSMRHVSIFGPKSEWLNLPEDADDFEEAALDICDRIKKGDSRFGKIPKKKKPTRMRRG